MPRTAGRRSASGDATSASGGRDFETEYRLAASEAGESLVALGEQLRDGDELTIVDDEWELPFAFGEPVEVEIEFEGVGEQELEIEMPGRDDESPERGVAPARPSAHTTGDETVAGQP